MSKEWEEGRLTVRDERIPRVLSRCDLVEDVVQSGENVRLADG
jgi:hypothetical protein